MQSLVQLLLLLSYFLHSKLGCNCCISFSLNAVELKGVVSLCTFSLATWLQWQTSDRCPNRSLMVVLFWQLTASDSWWTLWSANWAVTPETLRGLGCSSTTPHRHFALPCACHGIPQVQQSPRLSRWRLCYLPLFLLAEVLVADLQRPRLESVCIRCIFSRLSSSIFEDGLSKTSLLLLPWLDHLPMVCSDVSPLHYLRC